MPFLQETAHAVSPPALREGGRLGRRVLHTGWEALSDPGVAGFDGAMRSAMEGTQSPHRATARLGQERPQCGGLPSPGPSSLASVQPNTVTGLLPSGAPSAAADAAPVLPSDHEAQTQSGHSDDQSGAHGRYDACLRGRTLPSSAGGGASSGNRAATAEAQGHPSGAGAPRDRLCSLRLGFSQLFSLINHRIIRAGTE